MELIKINTRGLSSYKSIGDKKYLVSPVTMIVEGVLNGSGGPIYYPVKSYSEKINRWNGVPVTINHPVINGTPIPIKHSKEVYDKLKVGEIWNSSIDNGALKAELWIEEAKVLPYGAKVINGLKGENNLEVSTGIELELNNISGVFNNQEYIAIVEQLYPDHLALLPDTEGACSWSDGCGVRNESGLFEIEGLVKDYVYSKDTKNESCGVENIFNDYFIYFVRFLQEGKTKYFKESYVIVDGKLLIVENSKVEVVKSIKYKQITNERNEKKMCCPEKINQLIEDGVFMENQKTWLETLTEEQFDNVVIIANSKIKEVIKEVEKEVTFNELLGKASQEIRDSIEAGIQLLKEKKDNLISVVIANEGCKFVKEELEMMGVGMLEKMASLIPKKEVDFSINAAISANTSQEKTLSLPGMEIPKA